MDKLRSHIFEQVDGEYYDKADVDAVLGKLQGVNILQEENASLRLEVRRKDAELARLKGHLQNFETVRDVLRTELAQAKARITCMDEVIKEQVEFKDRADRAEARVQQAREAGYLPASTESVVLNAIEADKAELKSFRELVKLVEGLPRGWSKPDGLPGNEQDLKDLLVNNNWHISEADALAALLRWNQPTRKEP